MKIHLASLALLLPLAACLATPSETTESSASAVTVAPYFCAFPTPEEPSPTQGEGPKDGSGNCHPVYAVTIDQMQSQGVYMAVEAGLAGWHNPGAITFVLSGLPEGVTATWFQTQAYSADPDGGTGPQDMEGYFAFSAGATASSGNATLTLSDGTASSSDGVSVTVIPCTPLACQSDQCGTPTNNCGGTLDCGGCPLGGQCTEGYVCVASAPSAPKTCPAGTHACGGGICAKVCE